MLEATLRTELRALQGCKPEAACERHIVVLLHGWAGWSRQLLGLDLYLRRRLGRRVLRVDLGLGLDCIRRCAERAHEVVAGLAARGPLEAVDLVGYSMGGLVATELLKRLDGGHRVRSVVTLGTPHRGSPLARVALRLLRGRSASLQQMLPEADFLRDLGSCPLPPGTALYSVAGSNDLLVPPRYAELPRRSGCHNVVLLGADHWGLVMDASAHELVGALLLRQGGSAGSEAGECDRCEPEAPVEASRTGRV
jgi:pimeloyl-ACP methyl ester carboxylesterase